MIDWIRHNPFDFLLIGWAILSVVYLSVVYYWGEIACFMFGHKMTVTHQTETIDQLGRRVMYASQWGCFRCSKGGLITYTNKADKK